MTFTRRLTLAAAAAVAVVAVLGSVLTYVLVRNELRGEVDRSLRASGRRESWRGRVHLVHAVSFQAAARARKRRLSSE